MVFFLSFTLSVPLSPLTLSSCFRLSLLPFFYFSVTLFLYPFCLLLFSFTLVHPLSLPLSTLSVPLFFFLSLLFSFTLFMVCVSLYEV